MKHTLFLAAPLLLALSGCAEKILTEEETRVLNRDASKHLAVATKRDDGTLLGQASILADDLASAYFVAGVKASQVQDAVNAGVYLAAGTVVVGALGSASDRALTNRALVGVGLQSAGQNGLKQSEVRSLFSGATQLNCISGIASIYSSTTEDLTGAKLYNSSIAQHLVYAAIQDVRIATRSDLVRDVESFSEILKTFTDAVQTTKDLEETGGDKDSTPVASLNAFAAKLGACISSKKKAS